MIKDVIIVICIFTKNSNSVPGFEFGDNRAAKYLTDDNGVAEITFQEFSVLTCLSFLFNSFFAANKSDIFLRVVIS